MRSGVYNYNFALNLSESKITGCCVTSSHFDKQDNLVYDRGNLLTYLHYIGLSSKLFERVCNGENIDFPYRETFLHYRYLHEPGCPYWEIWEHYRNLNPPRKTQTNFLAKNHE